MKNLLFSVFLAVLVTYTGSGQSIYFKAGAGYGVPIAATSIGENYFRSQIYNGNISTSEDVTESVSGSYGAGVDLNFAFGYEFNENFIFELDMQYMMSNKLKTYDNYTYEDISDPLNPYSDVDNSKIVTSAKGLFFNPSVVFSAGFGKAAPYARFGFVLGSPQITGHRSSYYNGDGIDSTETAWKETKGISFGFQGAVGMNWKLNEWLDLYTELNFISMTYYPEEYNLTKSIHSDGYTITDNLPNLTVNQKQIIYKKKYDLYASVPQTEPSVALRSGNPFSSLSVQVGIKFSLGKNDE